ncbi:MAG: UDP-N-acetylmuramyl-tripeptide synthetase [Candidatus Adlerbacteria bacterium]
MRKFIPKKVLDLYHLLFAYGGAFLYRFPSKKLFVVGVTGTKGKSTTSELIRTVLAGAGHKVALASTIQFKIGTESEPNLFKMTMPGRAYLQKFLRKAVDAGCTHAVIEMTSEGAKQFRHKGIELDALVFTNLAPEHIESHGSLEAYAAAKLSLAKHLEESPKRPRYIVANVDDAYGKQFLAAAVEVRAPFSLRDAEPYTADDTSVRFMFKKGQLFSVPLPGLFSLKNILAAITLGDAIGVRHEIMRKTLEHIPPVAGRAEPVERGQDFSVIVDYAHTPDSLRALFETYTGKDLICVMGSTGGGRDQWKRPLMGTIADELCSHIFLTNEDPYDENPTKIIVDIAGGFTTHIPEIILDRREAIAKALRRAKKGSVVAITGKGTDPYIMGAKGSKIVWSDKRAAEEELDKLLGAKS